MVILQSLALAALAVGFGRDFIRRRAAVCYVLAALIALGSVWGLWSGAFGALPVWCARYVSPMFTRGSLAAALFFFVMFAGAAPNGSAFAKRVMPVRGELSIVASILAIGHGVALLKPQLSHVLSGEAEHWLPLVAALVLIGVMLPLFVTSFKRVRRRMKPLNWKRLQRCAYGFYALVFLHVLLYNVANARRGVAGAQINVVVYGALFAGYAALRTRKALIRRVPSLASLPAIVGAAALAGLIAVACPPVGAKLQTAVAEAPAAEETATAAGEALSADAAGSNAPVARYADGKYSGAGIGYNGRLTVSVTVEDGVITKVSLSGSVDDDPYIDAAAGVFPAVLAAQSAEVDAVSGATTSAEGLIEAVAEALDKAKAD